MLEPQAREQVIYCNVCLGIPPILIDSPLRFFGIQIIIGFVVLLAWLVIDQGLHLG